VLVLEPPTLGRFWRQSMEIRYLMTYLRYGDSLNPTSTILIGVLIMFLI
jgi:hypothetical protein